MTNEQPTAAGVPPKDGEIPLEDIDRLLEQEDPDFTKSLEEVRSIESDKSVDIEATADLGDDPNLPAANAKPETGWRKVRTRIREAITRAKLNFKVRMVTLGRDSLIFIKTKPKEFALYSVVMLKSAGKNAAAPLVAYKNADRSRKVLVLLLILMGTASVWILLANFKGIWIPQLTEPILRNFETGADWVEEYDPKQPGESFYAAFPQERHEFLFRKMKVNLKRTKDNPLPMGAFEIIVLLDSKDTALEVRDRETEFFDLLQRVFEDETFNDLESELGKNRLKGRIKRELNQKLTQGWIKDVSYKTFILKP